MLSTLPISIDTTLMPTSQYLELSFDVICANLSPAQLVAFKDSDPECRVHRRGLVSHLTSPTALLIDYQHDTIWIFPRKRQLQILVHIEQQILQMK
jgi:hypothetical protein